MSRARLWVVAGAVVAAVLVTMLALSGGGPAESPAAPPPPAPAPRLERVGPATPGPSTERDGMPAGFARSEAGARAAAMAYASASQRWLYFDDAGVEQAVRAITTASAAPRLTADVVGEVRTAREGLAAGTGRVWWIVRPLASKVETHRVDSARVSVWIVSVLSAADAAMPQSDWRTVTIELRWEDGDWRVDRIQDRAGPTPMLGPRDRPWPPELLDLHLEGFARVEELSE